MTFRRFSHGSWALLPWVILFTIGLPSVRPGVARADDPGLPNVLWISSEDHGQEMGCYGDRYADTPNVDALAARGLLYRNVWSTAPVCAPARTTIISGIYPPSLGAEHMRSMVAMPPGTEMFPEILRRAGYYCTNNSKTDYNLPMPSGLWDESSRQAHYKNRSADQPFFAVFNSTVSHESAIRNFKGEPQHDPAAAPVPAYHPDTPLVRRDWAIYYDTVTAADEIAGRHLQTLEKAGLAESTIVFYWGDHGTGMPRGKRWPSDSGLRVPLIVYIPEAFAHLRPADYSAGGHSDTAVGFIDFAPTMLSLAGIEPPSWMQGHAFLGRYATESPRYLYGFRGRMDERVDLVRSVTDGRYVYLRNYMPHLSQGQHVSYQMETPTTRHWRALFDAGELNAAQSRFWDVPKDPEELYDLHVDPDEVDNLAGSPEHQSILEQFRLANREHLIRTRDLGFMPEAERARTIDGITPYEFARDDQAYPLEKIMNAAELASQIDDTSAETLDQLVELTESPNAVLRYWGALGLQMRGETIVAAQPAALWRRLHDDESTAVRVIAAEVEARFADGQRRNDAIASLLGLADWHSHDLFTAMAALASLETIADSLKPQQVAKVGELPSEGPSPDGRYASYVPRLLKRLKSEIVGDDATER